MCIYIYIYIYISLSLYIYIYNFSLSLYLSIYLSIYLSLRPVPHQPEDPARHHGARQGSDRHVREDYLWQGFRSIVNLANIDIDNVLSCFGQWCWMK